MLRVAVPNKGTLSETAIGFLKEAGYRTRRDPNDLIVLDVENETEFFYLRPRDIATYVGSGAIDVGITGRDLLLDSKSEAKEISDLGFGASTFRFAAPAGMFDEIGSLAGARIATSYPDLVERFLKNYGVDAQVIKLDGAVESAVRLGIAEAVADVVATGSTLKKAGLEIFGPVLLESTAVLISSPEGAEGIKKLEARLRGIRVGREYVLVDYDIPKDLLDDACVVTPGIESPTVSPLQDPEWLAVRALVKSADVNKIMDKLQALGAKAVLVSALKAARL